MEQLNFTDLIILRKALKQYLEMYSKTQISNEREEETLEKVNELVRVAKRKSDEFIYLGWIKDTFKEKIRNEYDRAERVRRK